jgi:hypothetical protein
MVKNGGPLEVILAYGIFIAQHASSVEVVAGACYVFIDIPVSPHVDGFSCAAPIGAGGATSQFIPIYGHLGASVFRVESLIMAGLWPQICLLNILAIIRNI